MRDGAAGGGAGDATVWVEAGGVSLRARLSGGGPRGLALLHELGGTLEGFDGVLAALGDGFRTLRHDARGAGLSEKPRAPHALADQARDLAALMRAVALPRPALLVGVAAGAAVAVLHALAEPGAVAGLLLCCPALGAAPERRAYLDARSALAAREGMRAVAEASLARSFPPLLRGDGAPFAAYRARFLANDPVCYGHANAALAGAALEGELERLRVPCRVLAGRHDLLRPPSEVAALAARIPGARFDVVEEGGHLLAVQAPAAVAAAIRALAADLGG